MKTKTYHISNFGSFAPAVTTDSQGYVTYHDSPRYGRASNQQLAQWTESRVAAVRAAAATEMAERRVSAWRRDN